MNLTPRFAVLTAAAVLVTAGSVVAAEQPLRQLLEQGYTIVGTELVPSDVGQRAMDNTGWKDELLITLERGNSVAFCHTLLAATVDNDSVLDVGCFVPAGIPPASSSEAPPSDTPPSSEAPPPDTGPPPDSAPPPAAPPPPAQ